MNHEIISEKQYEKSFEELYGAKIAQVYDQEIVEFFIGKNYYQRMMNINQEMRNLRDSSRS